MDGDFISDDDLLTFEGWLRYQAVPAASTPEELEVWRGLFDESTRLHETSPKVGLMKLRRVVGEQKYAIAIREGASLWLTMWVRCSRKGEIFVMYPRGDRASDVHASYHLDGTFHQKSYGRTRFSQTRQPLTAEFRGSEHLGAYGGHRKGSGAVCDPEAFDRVMVVGPRILGPAHGSIAFDLVEPGYVPKPGACIPDREVFLRGGRPSVVVTVYRDDTNIGFLHWPESFTEAA